MFRIYFEKHLKLNSAFNSTLILFFQKNFERFEFTKPRLTM